ncbi:MAG: ATP-grasp domain-containing protein [Methylohalobius sp.]
MFEYITGGGLAAESLPLALAREAEVMLNAQLRDLAERPLKILRDRRLPMPAAFRHCRAAEILPVGEGKRDFASTWQTALDWAEMVWVTAPETGGLLAELSGQVLKAGKKLLGSHPRAVALAGDKLATLHKLAQAKVECVPVWPLGDFTGQVPSPWVVKPRDGVGCEGVVLVQDQAALDAFPRDWLLQPFILGDAMSLSAIFAGGESVLLSANRQIVQNRSGSFHLLGCEVNAFPSLDRRWHKLCDRIATAIPELWGYVGIDLIMTAKGALVLEINPRLTLSYAGLSSALGESIGAWIVDLAKGEMSLSEISRRRSKIIGRQVWVGA